MTKSIIALKLSYDWSKRGTNIKLSSSTHPDISCSDSMSNILTYWKENYPSNLIEIQIEMMLSPDTPYLQFSIFVPITVTSVKISSSMRGMINIEANHKITTLCVPMLAHAYLKTYIAIDRLVVYQNGFNDDKNTKKCAELLEESCIGSINIKNDKLYDILVNDYNWSIHEEEYFNSIRKICSRSTIDCCICYDKNPATHFKCKCTKVNTCIACFKKYGGCPICRTSIVSDTE